jgi:hypothetical protein
LNVKYRSVTWGDCCAQRLLKQSWKMGFKIGRGDAVSHGQAYGKRRLKQTPTDAAACVAPAFM